MHARVCVCVRERVAVYLYRPFFSTGLLEPYLVLECLAEFHFRMWFHVIRPLCMPTMPAQSLSGVSAPMSCHYRNVVSDSHVPC